MINIRTSVFETNSSSTHSVSISNKNSSFDTESLKRFIQKDNYLHISFGEFGWEHRYYCDPLNKLIYLIQMICCTHGIDCWYTDKSQGELREQLESVDEWDWVNNYIKNLYNIEGIWIDSFDGYIDHQSYEDYDSAHDFLNDYGLDMERFIFDSGVDLITSNDNGY